MLIFSSKCVIFPRDTQVILYSDRSLPLGLVEINLDGMYDLTLREESEAANASIREMSWSLFVRLNGIKHRTSNSGMQVRILSSKGWHFTLVKGLS